jgi:COP9 signalosome complex subunit 4
LLSHQKITDVDGTSALQRSVVEHNVLAAAKLYKNITFESLGELLGITATKAEKITTAMISTDRLRGADIDQLDQTISFDGNSSFLYKSSNNCNEMCFQTRVQLRNGMHGSSLFVTS